jgi:alcohol dehydrogenase YqhD (iron-dependent ADH family)
MINFEFSIPTIIKFGRDSHLETGKLISRFGKRVLIHYGSERIKKNGLLGEVEKLLEEEGVSYIKYGGVKANPSVEMVDDAISICKLEKVDCILAIGGGSVVDSSKAIAVGAFTDANVWDIYSDKSMMPKKALPIGVIITIPATGSEANSVSVISNYQKQDKRAIANPVCIPKFAILNPELTFSIPAYETAVAAVDIFSHCFERYFDLRRESQIWDALCEATMKTIIDITPKLINNLNDYKLRSEIMWSATVAHSNMLGTGGDFACHGLAHALTTKYHIPHGSALGLIMPAWCTYMYKNSKEKFDAFGQKVWNVKKGEESIECMKQFIKLLGLPISLIEAGVKEFNPEDLVTQAFIHGEEFLGGGLCKVYKADAEEIFRLL